MGHSLISIIINIDQYSPYYYYHKATTIIIPAIIGSGSWVYLDYFPVKEKMKIDHFYLPRTYFIPSIHLLFYYYYYL